MKILIVGHFAELVDLAIHLQEEGHDIYYYVDVKHDKEIGKGLVRTIKGWKQHAEDADLILFPDVYFGDLPLKYREKGKLVIGGSSLTDRLENDRDFATQVYDKFGLKYPKTWKFTSFDEAIDFVNKNPNRYVIKPQGQKPRIFTYVSSTEEDLILVLKHFKEIWPGKPEFILQEYVEGVEVACTGLFDGEKFLRPFFINFEHKRLGNNDKGPNTGEVGTVIVPKMKSEFANKTIRKLQSYLKLADYRGFFDLNTIVDKKGDIYILEATCFTEDAEILTLGGWKGPNDLEVGDLALTFNPHTGEFEYWPVTEIRVFEYDGPVVDFSNEYLRMVVTPDHEVWFEKEGNYFRCKAEDLVDVEIKLPVSGMKSGVNSEITTIPKVLDGDKVIIDDVPVNTADLLYFLGVYIGDGWHDSTRIYITRMQDEEKAYKIWSRLLMLPFPVVRTEKSLIIPSVQLSRFLTSIGFEPGFYRPSRKRIPPFVFQFSGEMLLNVLEGLTDANGFKQRKGKRVSVGLEELAEDIALLYLFCGLSPSINLHRLSPRLYFVHGAEPDNVNLVKGRMDSYKGYVWCPTVPPNHTVVYRYGTRPVITGQCRPGIPTIHVMDGLMKDKWSDVLLSVAEGRGNIINVKEEWCVGVVMISPPWPLEIKTDKFSDFPVFFPWKLVEKKKIHLGDLKATLVDNRVMITTAGNVGFTLVATGTGKDISEAQEEVYKKILPQVRFSLGFYRTDIGDRVKKQVNILKRFGYL